MLQFITIPGAGQLTPVEQARQAMAGGCRWIEIDMPGASDNEVRNAAMDLIRECEDTNTFLIIRGHIDVVDELKVSGIHVSSIEEGAEARQRLGAHAIIGVDASTAEEVKQLKPKDLDYAFLSISSPDTLAAIVKEVKDAGIDEPVVAGAGVTLDNLSQIMATGVNGVAMSEAIATAPDPMLYTMKVMEQIIPIKQ
ncbi:MAG: thiamine phosphate synthase [Pseudoflavonifractor sp.]|nr:thiamine phosphate synthase [Alloprevotella sp.]MCM1116748.1 thiamine phosphate synthase [Pseudoflavonifractor sp.]